jgi:hypothetical protein
MIPIGERRYGRLANMWTERIPDTMQRRNLKDEE